MAKLIISGDDRDHCIRRSLSSPARISHRGDQTDPLPPASAGKRRVYRRRLRHQHRSRILSPIRQRLGTPSADSRAKHAEGTPWKIAPIRPPHDLFDFLVPWSAGAAPSRPADAFRRLAGLVVILSALFQGQSAQVIQRTGDVVDLSVQSLLTFEGIRWMLLSAVDNFINFAPLGPVLTVMIGIGVAERTGLISMGLKVLVTRVPASLLTATVVFAGVMSSMAADAGYVVLTPLGAMLFASVGRHPMAGLAAAYAGVSGGFSANLLITGLDPMLSALTQQAAQSLDPSYTVNPACNYYFMVASTVLITVLGTFVTSKIVEPMLGSWDPSEGDGSQHEGNAEPTQEEAKAFGISITIGVVLGLGILLLGLIPGAPLHDTIKEGEPAVNALHSFFSAIEILVTIGFIIPGIIYGVLTKSIRSDKDVAAMMSNTMASMGAYVVLAFVAGQFVAYFNWSHLETISAVKGAGVLKSIGLEGGMLMIAFLMVASR